LSLKGWLERVAWRPFVTAVACGQVVGVPSVQDSCVALLGGRAVPGLWLLPCCLLVAC